MKKFFVLFGIPAADMVEWAKTPEAERKAAEQKLMQEWKAWMAAHESFFVDKGGPLGKNIRVTKDGAKPTANDLNWWAVVQANSQEEAAQTFVGHPQVSTIGTAYIEVMPMPEMGMS
jgi:hypothetical protein